MADCCSGVTFVFDCCIIARGRNIEFWDRNLAKKFFRGRPGECFFRHPVDQKRKYFLGSPQYIHMFVSVDWLIKQSASSSDVQTPILSLTKVTMN